MRTYIVTEGKLEAALLERLLKCHPVLEGRRIEVRASGIQSTALFAAHTLLVLRHEPVAVIFSPETVSPDRVEEQRSFPETFLGEVAAPGTLLVLMVPPDVAVLLFQDEGIINAVVPGPLSFEDRIRARYVPRLVLTEQFTRAGEGPFPEALNQRIARADLSPLWRLEVLKPLEDFLLRVSHVQAAGSPASP